MVWMVVFVVLIFVFNSWLAGDGGIAGVWGGFFGSVWGVG